MASGNRISFDRYLFMLGLLIALFFVVVVLPDVRGRCFTLPFRRFSFRLAFIWGWRHFHKSHVQTSTLFKVKWSRNSKDLMYLTESLYILSSLVRATIWETSVLLSLSSLRPSKSSMVKFIPFCLFFSRYRTNWRTRGIHPTNRNHISISYT